MFSGNKFNNLRIGIINERHFSYYGLNTTYAHAFHDGSNISREFQTWKLCPFRQSSSVDRNALETAGIPLRPKKNRLSTRGYCPFVNHEPSSRLLE
ncbi:hypothetical protein QE152_g19897 [Popillia japonica]|uniref:Uncharacterized protein n=1 Tax=Popillia japonica TaxID=7064 RepID=A0AAW1KMN8_POPJA